MTAKIAIIGSGVVGTAVGIGFKKLNNDVIFHDIDENKIKLLEQQGLSCSGDLEYVTRISDIFFITVPTPDKDKKIDLSIIKNVIVDISKYCLLKDRYFLIVIKSTVIPTTTEKIIIPTIEKYSDKKIGKDFGVCFNPEFLRDGYAIEDFMDPDRIIIGEYDKKSGDYLENIYSSFNCPIIRSDLKTSEMVKYANNCFYATKISFFNEIHQMCQRIGIDSNIIRKAVQLDKFYATHPWEHGHSFGGKCLPKDLSAIISMFNEGHIYEPILLKSVREVNEKMIEREFNKNDIEEDR